MHENTIVAMVMPHAMHTCTTPSRCRKYRWTSVSVQKSPLMVLPGKTMALARHPPSKIIVSAASKHACRAVQDAFQRSTVSWTHSQCTETVLGMQRAIVAVRDRRAAIKVGDFDFIVCIEVCMPDAGVSVVLPVVLVASKSGSHSIQVGGSWPASRSDSIDARTEDLLEPITGALAVAIEQLRFDAMEQSVYK